MLAGAFALLATVLLVLVLREHFILLQFRSDVRFGCDIIWGFHADRDLALKGDIHRAGLCLERLQVAPSSRPFTNPLADLIESERKSAIREIIAGLRAKTGMDYGDSPKKWVDALEGADHGKVQWPPPSPQTN